MADLAPRPPVLITTRWYDLLGRVLHHEIALGSLHAILVRIVVHDRVSISEVVPRRGRRDAPFKGCGIPRILWSGFALEPAVNQVEEEDELPCTSDQRAHGHKLVHANVGRHEVVHERLVARSE